MRKILFFITCASLLAFGMLSKYEDRQFMRNLDYAVTVKVQDRIDKSTRLRLSSFIGNTMEGATFFASPGLTVLVTLIVTGMLLYDRRKKSWHVSGLIVPVALIAIVVFEIYGKSIVHHPSPPFGMVKHPTTIFPADYVNEQYSYPSGHAARSLFMAIIIGITLWRERIRKKYLFVSAIALLSGYVLLVSVSKVYLGHHWFSDVVGGLLLGASFGLLSAITVLRKV
jgi:membrane-associated phospholipid phosphatase